MEEYLAGSMTFIKVAWFFWTTRREQILNMDNRKKAVKDFSVLVMHS
jgi:hypothetical protein